MGTSELNSSTFPFSSAGVVKVAMESKNSSTSDMDNYSLQVAVPKVGEGSGEMSFRLTVPLSCQNFTIALSAASSTVLSAFNNGAVTQVANVTLPEPVHGGEKEFVASGLTLPISPPGRANPHAAAHHLHTGRPERGEAAPGWPVPGLLDSIEFCALS